MWKKKITKRETLVVLSVYILYVRIKVGELYSLPFAHWANGIFFVVFPFVDDERKLSVCHQTKWTERTCPSMSPPIYWEDCSAHFVKRNRTVLSPLREKVINEKQRLFIFLDLMIIISSKGPENPMLRTRVPTPVEYTKNEPYLKGACSKYRQARPPPR